MGRSGTVRHRRALRRGQGSRALVPGTVAALRAAHETGLVCRAVRRVRRVIGDAAGGVPTFCSAIGDARVDATGYVKNIVADEDPRNALRDLVGKMCRPDSDAEDHMDELEAARKKWSARLALTEADWVDVALYATSAGRTQSGCCPSPKTARRPASGRVELRSHRSVRVDHHPMGASARCRSTATTS